MSPDTSERVDAGAAIAIAIMLTRFPTLTLFTEEIRGSLHMGIGPAGCISCRVGPISIQTIEDYTRQLTKALTQ